VKWCEEILQLSPLALRMLKRSFNAALDGQTGIQELAGDATMLFYMTEEAQEGRDAFKEKRKPDFRSSRGARERVGRPQASLGVWLMAARPRTLSASVSPVLVGTAVAHGVGGFRPLAALLALLASLLIQIGTNFANDYSDFKHGADANRVGPIRVTQSGLIAPGTVKLAAWIASAPPGCSGLRWRRWRAGHPRHRSRVRRAGWLYTGGPWPLGYHGLGDLFTFVFFGLVATCGTVYRAGALRARHRLGGGGSGRFARDCDPGGEQPPGRETDARVSKNTLAVKLGARATRAQYVMLVMVPFALAIAMDCPGCCWRSRPSSPRCAPFSPRTAPRLNRGLGETARAQPALFDPPRGATVAVMPARAAGGADRSPALSACAWSSRCARRKAFGTSAKAFSCLRHEGDRVGRGDAAPLPELGTESLAECHEQLRRARFDSLPGTPAARCAVEQAMLDLDAQRAGIPLARLLERAAPLESAGELAALGRRAFRAGARGPARSGGRVPHAEAQGRSRWRLRARGGVRDAAGPEIKLRLDANGAWMRRGPCAGLRELAPLGIELCEQPTPDLLGLEGSPVPLAADEMIALDPDGALERAQIVVLKPMLLGGLLPALRFARRAHERGRRIVVTSSLESPVGRAGAAHLAARCSPSTAAAAGTQPARRILHVAGHGGRIRSAIACEQPAGRRRSPLRAAVRGRAPPRRGAPLPRGRPGFSSELVTTIPSSALVRAASEAQGRKQASEQHGLSTTIWPRSSAPFRIERDHLVRGERHGDPSSPADPEWAVRTARSREAPAPAACAGPSAHPRHRSRRAAALISGPAASRTHRRARVVAIETDLELQRAVPVRPSALGLARQLWNARRREQQARRHFPGRGSLEQPSERNSGTLGVEIEHRLLHGAPGCRRPGQGIEARRRSCSWHSASDSRPELRKRRRIAAADAIALVRKHEKAFADVPNALRRAQRLDQAQAIRPDFDLPRRRACRHHCHSCTARRTNRAAARAPSRRAHD